MFYNDIERQELEAEFFAEDPGAVAARRHNEWEAHWAALEAEEAYLQEQNEANARYDDLNDPFVYEVSDECSNCGGVGYTIEINDEGVEFMTGCFDCYVEALDKEAA